MTPDDTARQAADVPAPSLAEIAAALEAAVAAPAVAAQAAEERADVLLKARLLRHVGLAEPLGDRGQHVAFGEYRAAANHDNRRG